MTKKPIHCKHCESDYHYSSMCPSIRKSIKRVAIKNTTAKTKVVKLSRSKLVKQLDSVFSLYIRQRDNGNGCITCGDKKPVKEMQNCHFFTRGRLPTRWDETNCHSGCYRCNVLLKGNYIVYTIKMIDKYDREYVDQLELKSRSNVKITTMQIREMIDEYKSKLKDM